MSDKTHVVEEISAYLDDEIGLQRRTQIEDHLRNCGDCNMHYQELRAVTTQVRSLRAPEVRPEFVTRVLARVIDDSERSLPWWQRFAQHYSPQNWVTPTLIACATILFMTGVVFASYRLNDVMTHEIMGATDASISAGEPTLTQGQLVAENVIDEFLGAGLETEDLMEYADAESIASLEDVGSDDGIDAEANEVIDTAFLAMLDAGWSSAGDDFYESISDLSVVEQAELQQLLQGGFNDSPSNEGYLQ